MRTWQNRVVSDIHFDVIHNGFWLADWGAQPDDPAESRLVVQKVLREAPALIPIYGHRAIPNEPADAGNPVFSLHQSDVIEYGVDLEDYLVNEFGSYWKKATRRSQRPSPEPPRAIRFWSHMVELNTGRVT
jgi:hypothetical protein